MMSNPEVTTYRPNRPPARSFAELNGAAPVEAPPAPEASEPPPEAPAALKLDAQDATYAAFLIDGLKAEMHARLGMLEARVERVDTIVESLESVIDAGDAPKGKPDSLVASLVQATVVDCLLPPMAALVMIARALFIEPKAPAQWARDPDHDRLPRELKNASPMAIKMVLDAAPREEAAPPKKRGPKPKPKPNRAGKAKATARGAGDGVPSPKAFMERLGAAGASQRDIAERAGVHQTQVSRFVRGHAVPAISRARMWAALERIEGGEKKPKKGSAT